MFVCRKFLRQFGSVSRSNPSRRLYNYSYNPVSRQDSELQSLSSDARTDSMSDLSLWVFDAARRSGSVALAPTLPPTYSYYNYLGT